MLEQERQKNRALTVEQATFDSVTQPPSIPEGIFAANEKPLNREEEPATASESVDLDHLIREQESLEKEFRRLCDEEEDLRLRAKMLCEQTIQEIRKGNSKKQQEVTQLKATIERLQAQLDSLYAIGTTN